MKNQRTGNIITTLPVGEFFTINLEKKEFESIATLINDGVDNIRINIKSIHKKDKIIIIHKMGDDEVI